MIIDPTPTMQWVDVLLTPFSVFSGFEVVAVNIIPRPNALFPGSLVAASSMVVVCANCWNGIVAMYLQVTSFFVAGLTSCRALSPPLLLFSHVPLSGSKGFSLSSC